MRNVIIPAEVDAYNINLSDVDPNLHCIVAYDGDKPIGFLVCETGDWRLQETSCYDVDPIWHTSLKDMINTLKRNYANFNLKVL